MNSRDIALKWSNHVYEAEFQQKVKLLLSLPPNGQREILIEDLGIVQQQYDNACAGTDPVLDRDKLVASVQVRLRSDPRFRAIVEVHVQYVRDALDVVERVIDDLERVSQADRDLITEFKSSKFCQRTSDCLHDSNDDFYWLVRATAWDMVGRPE